MCWCWDLGLGVWGLGRFGVGWLGLIGWVLDVGLLKVFCLVWWVW